MRKILLIISGVVFPLLLCAQPKLGKDTVEEVIAAMTLEEKAEMLVGIGSANWQVPTMLVPGAAGTTSTFEKYGITPSVMSDGPAGVHINIDGYNGTKHYCTAYPINTALAATWNPEVLETVGKSVANEVLGEGLDVILAPSMNIHRNILCGRNFEYYSEDPLISGKMGAAYVRGVQGVGAMTSVKHFIANSQESNRMSYNAVISQRALREIYLRGFEIAIKEGNPGTLMTSYNRVNGYYTSENPELLKDIVRDEWGYDGLIITDWGGGADPIAQMRAGNELLMYGNWQVEPIIQAVKDGILDEKVLDRNLKYVLEFIMKTPRFNGILEGRTIDAEWNATISKAAADEAMVLLKNDEVLPFNKKKIKKVALFGKSSYDYIACGTGSGTVNMAAKYSIDDALVAAGYKLDSEIADKYAAWGEKASSEWVETDWYKPYEYALTYYPEMDVEKSEVERLAKSTNIAVISIGRCSGEGWDRDPDDFFKLSEAEANLINDASEAFHSKGKKVVVVLNVSGAIETVSWRDKVDAILISWLGGVRGADSVVDILGGKVNPSGKLAMTYPRAYKDCPSYKTFPGEPKDNPINSFQDEGIYVGYRYYSSFNIPVAYEFGYGLSYTSFEYSDIEINEADGNLEVSFTIKNTGKMAGKEVAELYITAPWSIDKPAKELKAFAKTGFLKPGTTERIVLKVDSKGLSSFNTARSAWVADKGDYKIMVGSSSEDIRLEGGFSLENEIEVEKCHDVLYPNFRIQDMKAPAR
ncbi:MAG: glycoside hydrolase family 3 C-terminal domain-containing protein [Bacteroidales bacterium]|nr:glycoside hydrolase family 3 C-terminal domain-containing protein [Bacteroidales bacterium]